MSFSFISLKLRFRKSEKGEKHYIELSLSCLVNIRQLANLEILQIAIYTGFTSFEYKGVRFYEFKFDSSLSKKV